MRIEKPSFASEDLGEAIDIANRLLEGGEGFFEEVRQIQAFDFSENKATHKPVSGSEVVDQLSRQINVTVQAWKPFNCFTRAYATTRPGTVIYLNAYKLDREVTSLVGTLIHESVHIVDDQPDELSFGHGDNYSKGKENSAPNQLATIAERIAAKIRL